MRILFLSQLLPYPLDAGPKVRSYYVLRHLAQSHEVNLVTFTRQTDTDEAVSHLSEFCTSIHTVPMPRSKWLNVTHLARSLLTGRPFLIARDQVPEMDRMIVRVSETHGPFDAVHADQLWMAPYGLLAKDVAADGRQPATVLDQHNAVYMIPERLKQSERNPAKYALLNLEARKLARFEVAVCSQFNHVTWVTYEDYHAVASYMTPSTCHGAMTQRVPNLGTSVRNSGIIPICVAPEFVSCLRRKPDAGRITFLGGLHYPPNAEGVNWFAESVFPRVLQEAPEAVLTVIGKQPPKRLRELGIPSMNLDITGYVDDPTPLMEDTAVFIVPLHAGGGMRVKILSAWATGVPIVSTTVGAEGIQIRPEENILIADSAREFAEATVRVFKDRQFGDQLTQSGRSWVEEHYAWRKTYQMWDKIYTN